MNTTIVVSRRGARLSEWRRVALLSSIILLVLLLGLVRDLGAQSAVVAVGARVRVRAEYPYGQVVGRVERADRQTLRVVQDRTTAGLVVPMRYVQSIEVRRERSRFQGMQHGAVRGALVGAAAGLLIGAVTDDIATLGLVGLGAGAVGGAVYGGRRPGLTWERVDLPSPASSAPRR